MRCAVQSSKDGYPWRIRKIVTPLRGYTSSVTALPCHLPLKGKALLQGTLCHFPNYTE